MTTTQQEILRWAATQPVLTGLAVLGLGMVYAFLGFYMFRPLLGLASFALGWLLGSAAGTAAGLPAVWPAVSGGAAMTALAVKWPKPAVAAVSGATWGILGCYLATQFWLPPTIALVVGGFLGILGVVFTFLSYRTMTMVLTTLQGVVLMLIGFVTVASRVLPELGATFRQWAGSQALVVPVFLAMFFAAAISYQMMHQQGDIRTGR